MFLLGIALGMLVTIVLVYLSESFSEDDYLKQDKQARLELRLQSLERRPYYESRELLELKNRVEKLEIKKK